MEVSAEYRCIGEICFCEWGHSLDNYEGFCQPHRFSIRRPELVQITILGWSLVASSGLETCCTSYFIKRPTLLISSNLPFHKLHLGALSGEVSDRLAALERCLQQAWEIVNPKLQDGIRTIYCRIRLQSFGAPCWTLVTQVPSESPSQTLEPRLRKGLNSQQSKTKQPQMQTMHKFWVIGKSRASEKHWGKDGVVSTSAVGQGAVQVGSMDDETPTQAGFSREDWQHSTTRTDIYWT